MKLRTLTVLLTLGLACASAAAVPGNEGKETPAAAPISEAVLRRNGSADACRGAVWPYIPSACILNAAPEQQMRPVRVIRIEAAPGRG
jgi:hypothetical protein